MTLLPTGDPTTSIFNKFLAATDTYKGLSINALNFWRNPLTGIWDVQQWGSDQTVVVTIGGVSVTLAMVGVALFALAAVLALVAVARRDDMTGPAPRLADHGRWPSSACRPASTSATSSPPSPSPPRWSGPPSAGRWPTSACRRCSS